MSRWKTYLAYFGTLMIFWLCAAGGYLVGTAQYRNHIDPPKQRPIRKGVVLRMLPLGNSITWGSLSSDGNGYRQHLENMLVDNEVQYVGSLRSGTMPNNRNEGHPGATISEIASFLLNSPPSHPNVVLVMAGTNDCNMNLVAHKMPARLASLVDDIITFAPEAVVVVAGLPPINIPGPQSNVERLNAAIPGIVELRVNAGHHVMTVNMSDYLTIYDMVDGVHPTDEGYAKMAQGWFHAIQQATFNGWISPPVPCEDCELKELR